MHFKSFNVMLVYIYFFFKFPNTSTPTRVGVFHVLVVHVTRSACFMFRL